ncbi:MAG TPA: hypothetical protein VGG72_02230 [Bryobacteraceae bacterium]|jgi:hypothetical protein
MLDSLRLQVLPSYIPPEEQLGTRQWAIFEPWTLVQSDPARKKLVDALSGWAKQFNLTEEWILQAALVTLFVYWPKFKPPPPMRPPGKEWHWMYMPSGGNTLFQPKLEGNTWFPPGPFLHEQWGSFRRRIEAQVKAQLTAYKRTQEAKFSRADYQLTAEWTARYQKGELAYEIGASLKGPYKDHEQAVYRRIERFASMIGLNLRRSKKRGVVKSAH